MLPGNHVGIADICTASVGSFLATSAVAARLGARYLTGKRIALSDISIAISLVFALGLAANSISSVVDADNGMDTTLLGLQAPAKLELLRKYLFAQNILWASANTLVRISILLLYIDLFPLRTFQKVIYGFLALQILYWVEVVILRFFLCVPLSWNWSGATIPAAIVCREHVSQAAFINGVVNIVLDVSLVVLPMPILWSLRMATAKKVALSFIFGLGILICVMSILRVIFIQQSIHKSTMRTNIAYGSLAILEPLLGIVNACLPFFRPVLYYFFPSIGTGYTDEDYQYTSAYDSGYRYRNGSREGSARALRDVEESGMEIPFESTSTGDALKKPDPAHKPPD